MKARLAVALICAAFASLSAQQPPQASASPRASAPVDLTGYWVSLVTEDWRYRMTTPPKGDYTGVPLNGAGRKAADAWDPARDEAAGEPCKAYGVGGIMRMPGRLHITWQDDETLRVEADAGTQVRALVFRGPRSQGGDWQGASAAIWDRSTSVMGAAGLFAPAGARGGSLKVVTTGMRAGYLRKNGVPYSDTAIVTEYYDRHNEPNGDQWFTVTTMVEDPKFLTQPFITSSGFKKEADGAKWRATPCAAQ